MRVELSEGSEMIAAWIRRADDIVWGPGMLCLLLGTGGFLMLRLRFLPLRNLKYALLCAVGREPERESGRRRERDAPGKRGEGPERGRGRRRPDVQRKRREGSGGVSSFSALTTELAATIGTGNIVGVATAMVLGGPGALLWMLLSSLIGLATKLVESTLSVKYRQKNARGEWVGGPMYTMANAFRSRRLGRAFGCLFACFAVMASFGMGNMTQSNSIADALFVTFGVHRAKTGLAVSIATILVVLGGIGMIARVTQVLVPLMGALYLAGTLGVILTHLPQLPMGLWQIVTMAFAPQAAVGGVCGQIAVTGMEALRYGVSRGVFSNEAGLGAAGISAASADTSDYIRQGYISMTGVFLDTIVICSATGLAIASSGVLGSLDGNGGLLTGTALTIAVFGTTFGRGGAAFLSVCITLFAFATIVGWAYQGEKAFEFLVSGNGRCCLYYRFAYGLAAFVGAVCSLEVVWDFSDVCNALMAVPNLLCVIVLSRGICREIRERDDL